MKRSDSVLADEIAKIIINVAESENSILFETSNEGIFFMPELAFAYECGKQIILNSEKVFGSNPVIWAREKNLGNGGPSDLVFELGSGHSVAIEFKLRDKRESYVKDITKLSKLDDNTLKLFCSLVDVFDSKLPYDDRLEFKELQSDYLVNTIQKSSFKTKQNWYSSSVSCVVCVWSIGYVPEIPRS